MKPQRLIIISGLSGSGKSTAARALEDEGFFVVDNLPVVLLPELLRTLDRSRVETPEVAVVLDVRNREFLPECEAVLAELDRSGFGPEILFLDAEDSAILRRYSETRRRHPLALDKGVSDGILLERQLLSTLRSHASVSIDSTQLTPHLLRSRVVSEIYGQEPRGRLTVLLQSFGFRYGLPPDSDLVFDVRFLPNPHFIPELQPGSGLDPNVSSFVLGNEQCREFMDHLHRFLLFLLPRFREEGKSYLKVSIGCTGGRHRSVAIVEDLAGFLPGEGLNLKTLHRDVAREEVHA